ncbi:putative NBD/HSP70 family sugar kinase [Mycoplasmoides fastidiosum]|uniref:NBD/HSP70 family sugar kinase n=1 Tax=Mycoplasmoides fastidiosum TaxID=92758 RepID=A0ABU0LY91_9BACT|nr:ROK family protein [Mycoplasmoides fastidiosum]MDQ0513654.1 putative NBD/HSP70 family sugar kinase [Mycoplasmoides fastidiosum]UUD37926.1 ROK family protein [Mycoplasmoides fastidiosum]
MKQTRKYGCVDIGGTNVRFALVEDNQVVFFEKFSVDQTDPIKTLTPIFALVNDHQITTLGIACPGPAKYGEGIIIDPPNLAGWHNLNLKKLFQEHTKVREMIFENDANAAAYAVHHYFGQTINGVTQFYTISTGLGAGLIYKNEIFGGYNHLAQEVARAPLAPFVTKQTWNLSPHALELFTSGTGMVNRADTLGLKGVNAKWIFDHYQKNPVATQVVDEAIVTLSHLFATSMAFAAPNLFVVGGSVGIHNQWFVEKAFARAKALSWPNQYAQTQLVFDTLGDDVVLIGLNYLIRHQFQS